jgi:hypothetical protein
LCDLFLCGDRRGKRGELHFEVYDLNESPRLNGENRCDHGGDDERWNFHRLKNPNGSTAFDKIDFSFFFFSAFGFGGGVASALRDCKNIHPPIATAAKIKSASAVFILESELGRSMGLPEFPCAVLVWLRGAESRELFCERQFESATIF